MGPSDDFVITETTTGGDLIALFSETEAACARDTLGEEALAMIRDTRLMEISDAAPPIPFECLTPENVGNIGVAMIALQAGGLTPESRSCAKEVVIANPIVLTFQEPGPDTDLSALMAAGFQLQACFTPEEVAALNSIDGGAEGPPQEAEPPVAGANAMHARTSWGAWRISWPSSPVRNLTPKVLDGMLAAAQSADST